MIDLSCKMPCPSDSLLKKVRLKYFLFFISFRQFERYLQKNKKYGKFDFMG